MSKENGTPPPKEKSLGLKKMLSPLKEKLDFTYIAIIVLSIALYVGFDDLISGATSGTARDTISAALAAIFVLITTMYMLNKQTDVEQEKEFKGVIFNKKFEIYDDVINIWQDIAFIKFCVDDDSRKKCLNKHFEISMVAPEPVFKLSYKILEFLVRIYGKEDGKLNEEEERQLIKYIYEFTNLARNDFNLSKIKQDTKSIKNITQIQDELINELQKQSLKNFDKFEFFGKKYNKVDLVNAVVRKVVDDKKVKSINDLKVLFPDKDSNFGKPSTGVNAFVVELKSVADEKNARYSKKSENMIKLENSNEQVITNNQWGRNFDHFKGEVEKRFNYTITRHIRK